MFLKKLRNAYLKKLISSLVIILILFSSIYSFREVIFQLPFEKIKGNNKNSAIIYIWGLHYFRKSDVFDPCGLTTAELDEIEHKCALSELDMLKEVQKKWGWDIFFYYGIQPRFQRHEYDNLLIIFSGHGSYENSHQVFVYNANRVVEVKRIGKGINCHNLTVIVDSCYSLNWNNDFQHDNLTNIFTSDLCNSTSYSMPYPSCTTEVENHLSFSRVFLINLYNGLDYFNANKTTFEWYYYAFPQINCSF